MISLDIVSIIDSKTFRNENLRIYSLFLSLSLCLSVSLFLSKGAIQSTEVESETHVLDVKVNAKENNWCNCLIGGCQVTEKGRKCN